jgi:Ca-activated chloride channel family protein
VAIFWAKLSAAIRQTRTILNLPAGVRSGTLLRYFLSVIVALSTSCHVAAQLDTNEAHVLPRVLPTPPRDRPQHVLRTNVDLVLVNVAVLDHAGRAVSGLGPANFSVLDDNYPQVVKYLSRVDEPISLVVVLDASASMASKIEEARKALTELVNTSNPQDDFSLIIIGDEPRVAVHFDEPASGILEAAEGLQPDGATALWDGMYLGIKELKNSRYPKKAMVVISDGGDNHSRYTESELKSLLKEADVEVYAVGIFDRDATRPEEKTGPRQLDEVTSITGGRVLSAHDSGELSRAVTQINQELHNQYVLGYYPSQRTPEGKWRKIKVRLVGASSQARFRLYAKKGYYSHTE